MILHTDIPTRTQVDRLLASRNPCSVSIYLATDPTSPGAPERIELKNLAAEAVDQLRRAGGARDAVVPGSISPSGAVTFGEIGADDYGILDEIARRVWLTGGRVLAVRRDDIPGREPVAAILRHAPPGA